MIQLHNFASLLTLENHKDCLVSFEVIQSHRIENNLIPVKQNDNDK